MGLFNWANLRNREGKGVEKKESENAIVVFFGVFGRKFWRFITLNLIYAILGLPIWLFMYIGGMSFLEFLSGNPEYNRFLPFMLAAIPMIALIGSPATMGVTYILRNFSRQEHAWVPGDLFDKASKNYVQSLLIGLINSIVAFLLLFAYFYYGVTYPTFALMRYIVIALLFIFIMMRNYLYLLAVTYKLSLKKIYQYALILTFVNLPQNAILVAVCMGLIWCSFYYMTLGYVLTTVILPVFLGYLTCFYCDRVISKNVADEIETDQQKAKS